MNNKEVIDYKDLFIEVQYDEIDEDYIATCRTPIGNLVISGNTRDECIRDIKLEIDGLGL